MLLSLKVYKLIQFLKESPFLLNVLLWVIARVAAIMKVGPAIAVSLYCEGTGKNTHYISSKLASYVSQEFKPS